VNAVLRETRRLTPVWQLLAARGLYAIDAKWLPVAHLVGFVIAGGGLYGFAMGAFGGRFVGGLYSATKVPILILGAMLLCLPNFYVVNALLGLRADFRSAVRGILATQAAVALCLAGLAPVLSLFYASRVEYPTAMLLNAASFASAVIGGQVMLRRHYAPLIARNRRHTLALWLWGVLYVFVTIKLGWVLRPFIGDPELPIEFMRAEQWQENPYTTLVWTAAAFVWQALGGN
jgi:hypothetical protein